MHYDRKLALRKLATVEADSLTIGLLQEAVVAGHISEIIEDVEGLEEVRRHLLVGLRKHPQQPLIRRVVILGFGLIDSLDEPEIAEVS